MKQFISILKCNQEKIAVTICETEEQAIQYFANLKQLPIEEWSKIYEIKLV